MAVSSTTNSSSPSSKLRMSQVSILTDSAAQFSSPIYEGSELVTILPLQIQVGSEWFRDTRDPRTCARLITSGSRTHMNGSQPRLHPPSVNEFVQAFTELSQKSSAILAILSAERLCHDIENARLAADIARGPAAIYIIDSQTTGAGLGFLIEYALQMAEQESNPLNLTRLVRGAIPHIYSAFCLQSLRALAQGGHMEFSQALVGEMLGMLPFYVMENGRLMPMQKARSQRQVIDLLLEFASEFENLRTISLLQGLPPYEAEMRNLRDRLSQTFPKVQIFEHMFSASLLTIFGSRSLGLMAMESFALD
jgi:DegV family protein with EDD domain